VTTVATAITERDADGIATAPAAPPRDNLIRARVGAGVELRAAGDGQPSQLYGIFSEFNTWYEIDSFWEGSFLERVAPGAFARTITEDRASMRVLFDHGMDPALGFKPLGPIRTLEERTEGPYYEVDLLDTDYNRDFIIPALAGRLMDGTDAGSQLGASFRFQVLAEAWEDEPDPAPHNPQGLPERTIQRARVFEFGPVTFPANPGATAGVRSLSDTFLARLRSDRRFFTDFTERVGAKVVRRILAAAPEQLAEQAPEQERPAPPAGRLEQLRRRARAIVVTGR
jgi:HK97 family phage prohead protease